MTTPTPSERLKEIRERWKNMGRTFISPEEAADAAQSEDIPFLLKELEGKEAEIQDKNRLLEDLPEALSAAQEDNRRLREALEKVEKYAFKASGDEFLMWAQEALSSSSSGEVKPKTATEVVFEQEDSERVERFKKEQEAKDRVVEAGRHFVKWIEEVKDPHLIDTDDNPGQVMREALHSLDKARKA